MLFRKNVVERKWCVRYSWGRKSDNHFAKLTVYAESEDAAEQKAEEALKLRFDTPADFDICSVDLMIEPEG